MKKSDFHLYREQYQPEISQFLQGEHLDFSSQKVEVEKSIRKLFPQICKSEVSEIKLFGKSDKNEEIIGPLRIGCVLSGGQASGGHNVIVGLYDYIKKINVNSQLFGFLNGPAGIYQGKYMELSQEVICYFKNRGGFDMIKSGRNKIETEEQFAKSKYYCELLKLDGLVVIGGDDSNTNACLLAEYFLRENCNTKVIGCPKTIDGDLKNEKVEVSFGFDTACKTYAEQIGNLMIDTLSTKKYYHFIRLMGRSASHIALECALLTRPTYALIGEEVQHHNHSLHHIVNHLKNLILKRAYNSMNYGIILVPEGLIEFIPEMNVLIKEINQILAADHHDHHDNQQESNTQNIKDVYAFVLDKLTPSSKSLLTFLPKNISNQLLLDRDPHGNVQVAKIETEKLLISLLEQEINKLENKISFKPQSHYFGYEGRCAFPTKFDTDYCYNLGLNAAVLIQKGFTGLMSCITNLKESATNWIPCGYPLVSMMNVELRKGKDVPVIRKALTELDGELFKYYKQWRDIWAEQDYWRQIGPIQYEFQQETDVPYLAHFSPQQIQLSDPCNAYSTIYESNLSSLAKARAMHKVQLNNLYLQGKYKVELAQSKQSHHQQQHKLLKELNYLYNNNNNLLAEIVERSESDQILLNKNLKIGIVYCARQSPGGNNIIDGLLDFVKLNGGKLIGFINGTKGLLEGKYMEIKEDNYKWFRNQGGYHMLGRSADKLRFSVDQEKTKRVVEELELDGLVMVGASHTYTDAAYLTNYFIENNVKTRIITVPCTIDNNLGHHMLELSVGFDTASKMYSQLIGNIMIDSASAVKYWYFIRLMGRNPSHLLLETALQSKPNLSLISEEISYKGQSLENIVHQISDLIQLRANHGKNYGCVLIPEGIISYLPLFKQLLEELNQFILKNENQVPLLLDPLFANQNLSPWGSATFNSLPDFTKKQLILEREVHGSIQLSQIETERLLAFLVEEELKKRKSRGEYKQSFASICHYFGYQGRSGMPSIFDCQLGTAYGFTAGILIENNLTGYSVTGRGLQSEFEKWHLGGIPLINFIKVKDCSSYGNDMPIVPSNDVQLQSSNAFNSLVSQRDDWKITDCYANSGPTQFYGSKAKNTCLTIQLQFQNYQNQLHQVQQLTKFIQQSAKFGVHEDLLNIIINNLHNLKNTIHIVEKNLL